MFTDPPLDMAALAFSAYGMHWFAIGWNRYQGNDPRPNVGMSIGVLIISALGGCDRHLADVPDLRHHTEHRVRLQAPRWVMMPR